MNDIPKDLEELCKLTKSIQEEAQAFTDYKIRASKCSDKASSDLFLHLADEEAKHFSMLVAKLTNIYDAVEYYLSEFLPHSKNPLEIEKD